MRAKDYRARKRDRLSTITVEATGEQFIVRRVQVDAWIMAGKIPETLAREVLTAWNRLQATDPDMASLSVDQMMSGFQVLRDLVVYACVSPKLVVGEEEADPEKDEIHFIELEPEERAALINYCMQGTGATPIDEADGQVTPEVVTRFPDDAQRREPLSAGQDGGEVRDAPVDAAANRA
jgi:hypothetical protein